MQIHLNLDSDSIHTLSLAAAYQSTTIQNLIKSTPNPDGLGLSPISEEINIKVPSQFNTIIPIFVEYLKRHEADAAFNENEYNPPLLTYSSVISDLYGDADANFIEDLTDEQLQQLTTCADYFDVPRLYLLCLDELGARILDDRLDMQSFFIY